MTIPGPKPEAQEKTLPREPVESPKQKKLIILFAGIAALVIVSYSIYLQFLAKDDFAATKNMVVSALAAKDTSTLLTLASKDFLVGQPESENSATTDPKLVMGKIVQLTEKIKWSGRFQDFDNSRVLYPESGSFQLLFTHTDKVWIWSGFLAVNPDDLAVLASDAPVAPEKIEYKEIRTEEATGDEPSISE